MLFRAGRLAYPVCSLTTPCIADQKLSLTHVFSSTNTVGGFT
jgi:hypothetical protein